MPALIVKEGLVIPEDQLRWSYVRSGGPGGQNVNKVNSKAVLRWQPPGDFLPPAAWARFQKLANRYLTVEGEVVIASDEYRDQLRNTQRSADKLRVLLLTALVPPKRRVATRPTKSSRLRRLAEKRRSSEKKQSRRTTPD
jgi:ribosome-associated protein